MSDKKAHIPSGLPPEKLRWRCDASLVPYATTDEAPLVAGEMGQERALRACKWASN